MFTGYSVNAPHESEGPVAGDIATNGGEILIKTYKKVYYWQREPGELLNITLSRTPKSLPYTEEPQGEAIAWTPTTSGYFTLSEGYNQLLLFYGRV